MTAPAAFIYHDVRFGSTRSVDAMPSNAKAQARQNGGSPIGVDWSALFGQLFWLVTYSLAQGRYVRIIDAERNELRMNIGNILDASSACTMRGINH